MKQKKSLVAAFDVGGTNLRAALVDDAGAIVARVRRATVADRKGFIEQLAAVTDELQSTASKRVAAIAIGFPGPLKTEEGRVLTPPNLPACANLPVKRLLERETGLPVFLENDANAAALGEWWRGAAKGAGSVLCFTLGTGVGGGIVLNGEVWHGAGDVAGEFGHITVRPGGRLCGCGRRGCLETYASATGVARTARAMMRRRRASAILRLAGGKISAVTSEVVYRAAKKGDGAAREIIREAGRMLGFVIGNLMGAFNPEVVVITGGMARAGGMLLKPLRDEAARHCFASAFESAGIAPGRLGDDAGMLGAALTAFRGMEKI